MTSGDTSARRHRVRAFANGFRARVSRGRTATEPVRHPQETTAELTSRLHYTAGDASSDAGDLPRHPSKRGPERCSGAFELCFGRAVMFAEENWRGRHMVRGFDVARAVYATLNPSQRAAVRQPCMAQRCCTARDRTPNVPRAKPESWAPSDGASVPGHRDSR